MILTPWVLFLAMSNGPGIIMFHMYLTASNPGFQALICMMSCVLQFITFKVSMLEEFHMMSMAVELYSS